MRRRVKEWTRRVVRCGVVIGVAYAALVVAACAVQDRIVFPRHLAGSVPSKTPVLGGMEPVWVETDPGVRVEGWFFVRANAGGSEEAEPGPAVLFAHGNGETIDDLVGLARWYAQRGVSVLLAEYRGYGRSGGTPGEEAIDRDMRAFFDWLSARPEVDPERVLLHGRSLGGGVAMKLTRSREPAGVILESTFTSVVSMSRRFLVPSFVVRHPYRSDTALVELEVPVLILHGRKDRIIPLSHGERLHGMARDSEFVVLDAGHNDMMADREAYFGALERFMSRWTDG